MPGRGRLRAARLRMSVFPVSVVPVRVLAVRTVSVRVLLVRVLPVRLVPGWRGAGWGGRLLALQPRSDRGSAPLFAERGSSAQTSSPGPVSWAPQAVHIAATRSNPLPCSSSGRCGDGWGSPGAHPSSRTAIRTRSPPSCSSHTTWRLAVCTMALVTSSETTSSAVSQVSSQTDQPESRARVRCRACAAEPGCAASSKRNRRSAAVSGHAPAAAPRRNRSSAASVPNGADGITFATISPS